jgi:hypothetical protein
VQSSLPRNPREIITSAERRFPVRIRIAIPPGGLGRRHAQIAAWLDENRDADGWAMTPSGTRGALNDALSIYFADATLASAFVARWCVGSRVETAGGVFQVREDERNRGLGPGRGTRRPSSEFNLAHRRFSGSRSRLGASAITSAEIMGHRLECSGPGLGQEMTAVGSAVLMWLTGVGAGRYVVAACSGSPDRGCRTRSIRGGPL